MMHILFNKHLIRGALLIPLVMFIGCGSKNTASKPAQNENVPPNSSTPLTPTPTPTPTPNADTEKYLGISSVFPGSGEEKVALVTAIHIQFDSDLIQGLSLDDAIRVSSSAREIAGSTTRTGPNSLIFRAERLLSPETLYTVTLSDKLMSAQGIAIKPGTQWTFTTVADVYTTPQDIIDHCMSDLDIAMLAAVNKARSTTRFCGENQRNAVGKLIWSCKLQQSAIIHSEDMANHNFFSHQGSDGSSASERISRAGYTWSYVGENLAAGQRTVEDVIADLLESPGHCDNIMSTHFTEFGSSYRESSSSFYKRYWTQNFGRPLR